MHLSTFPPSTLNPLPIVVSTMAAFPEWYPTDDWSLEQFVDHAKSLLEQEDVERFLQFTLAGKFHDPLGNPRRVRVNPLLDSPSISTLQTIATRDYDSLIGITNDLPFLCPLAIYPIPTFRDTLTQSNRLTKRIHYQASSIFYSKLYTILLNSLMLHSTASLCYYVILYPVPSHNCTDRKLYRVGMKLET